jgi:coenzyme F420 hydrogenase subunit alpha
MPDPLELVCYPDPDLVEHLVDDIIAGTLPAGNGTPGWAVNEAPRGTLVHIAQVRNRQVVHYAMAVPTTWNMPTAGLALAGSPWQLAEFIIWGYDPCLSCATHMIVLDADRRIVSDTLIP